MVTIEPWPNDPPDVGQPFNIGAYARLLGLPIEAAPDEWAPIDYWSWREGWHWQDKQPDVGPVMWRRL